MSDLQAYEDDASRRENSHRSELKQHEEACHSLKMECDALHGKVRELESQLVQQGKSLKGLENYN